MALAALAVHTAVAVAVADAIVQVAAMPVVVLFVLSIPAQPAHSHQPVQGIYK
jgi:hypothetical protein